MRGLVTVLIASAALLPAAGAAAGPLHADVTLDEYFRVEWQPTFGSRGPALAGHVQNVSNLPVDRMQLLVERLDAAGTVIARSRTWIMGPIPAHQRSYFTTPVAAAPAYRIRILSFDWANCRD